MLDYVARAHTHTHTRTYRNWEHFSNISKSPINATSAAAPAAGVSILFSALSPPLASSSTLFDSVLRQLPCLSLSIPTNLRASEVGGRDKTVLKAIRKLNLFHRTIEW